jgi:hypothetical protein
MKTSDAVYHDFLTLMRNHHPLIAVSVDISMKQREAAFMMENKVKSLQGVPEKDLKPFNKVQEYRELVCSYLATDIENACYPQFMTQQQQPSAGRKVQIFSIKPQGDGIASLTTSTSEPSSNPVFMAGKRARNPRPCHLCMAEGHWAQQCMLYFGDQPGNVECPTCNGFHTLPCRETERAQVIQPVFARYRQRTEEWARKKEETRKEEETETTETATESEEEPGHEPEPQPEQQEQHRQEPPPPYWPRDRPRPRQKIEQWDRQQEDTNRTPQNTRYPPQIQDRGYQPRFNAHPNYYGNQHFNPHSLNQGRGDPRPRDNWQGNRQWIGRNHGYTRDTYDNRRERPREDPYPRGQPRRDPRECQRQQEGTAYQRDQQPVGGTLGNAGAKTPSASAFISRIERKVGWNGGYESGYDEGYPYHSYDRD